MISIHDSITFIIFIIFFGASIFATLALYTRQPLLIAYIAIGFVLGPYGFHVVSNLYLIRDIGDIGILFLLFLIGLNLQPTRLLASIKRVTIATLGASILLGVLTYLFIRLLGYSSMDGIVIATALSFSSTIIGLKLLPVSMLTNQAIGEFMISILLLQDLLAVAFLVFLTGVGGEAGLNHIFAKKIMLIFLATLALITFAFYFEKYVFIKLLRRFEKYKEYLFLLPIAWCLSLATVAQLLNLSAGIGAFIAGIVISEHYLVQYIAESLRPLRDFFLIAFFFSVGAYFNPMILTHIWVPVLLLSVFVILFKPTLYRFLLAINNKESKAIYWQTGWRLGQASEFSILIAYAAISDRLITQEISSIIQAITILTLIASSYIISIFYPTPIAFKEELRQD